MDNWRQYFFPDINKATFSEFRDWLNYMLNTHEIASVEQRRDHAAGFKLSWRGDPPKIPRYFEGLIWITNSVESLEYDKVSYDIVGSVHRSQVKVKPHRYGEITIVWMGEL